MHRRDKEHFFRLPPPRNALLQQTSKAPKLAKSAGKIGLNCDYCGLSYETYAAWAKRYANHYCSAACRYASQAKIVERKCPVCRNDFKVKTAGPFTCSDSCAADGLLERDERSARLADIRWHGKQSSAGGTVGGER